MSEKYKQIIKGSITKSFSLFSLRFMRQRTACPEDAATLKMIGVDVFKHVCVCV